MWKLCSILLYFLTLYLTQSKYHLIGTSSKAVVYFLLILGWFSLFLFSSQCEAEVIHETLFLAKSAHRRNTFEKFCSWSEVFKLYFIESWHLETVGQVQLYICVRRVIFWNLGLSQDIVSVCSSFVLFCCILSCVWCTFILPHQVSSSLYAFPYHPPVDHFTLYDLRAPCVYISMAFTILCCDLAV